MRVDVSRFRAIHQGALLAACTVTVVSQKGEPILDIASVKLMDGHKGRFVSMPAEKGRDQKYYSLVFIRHRELKQLIEDAVLNAFDRSLGHAAAPPPAVPTPAAAAPQSAGGPACLA